MLKNARTEREGITAPPSHMESAIVLVGFLVASARIQDHSGSGSKACVKLPGGLQ